MTKEQRARKAFVIFRDVMAPKKQAKSPQLSNLQCSLELGKQWREATEDFKEYWRQVARQEGRYQLSVAERFKIVSLCNSYRAYSEQKQYGRGQSVADARSLVFFQDGNTSDICLSM
jgi:HMG (high mobility group) box